MQKSLTCVATLLATLAGAVHAQGAPAKSPAFEAFGRGVQIYTCKEVYPAYVWSLKAPDASLLDAKGQVIGKHFAGPTWQANDRSMVMGELLSASPSPDAGAIAWLVVRAKDHIGSGTMATVQYIVRTHTEGGVAPSSGCDADHMGDEVRVPYSAVYLFFRG